MNKLLMFFIVSIFVLPCAYGKTEKVCSHLNEMENFTESDLLKLQKAYGDRYVKLMKLAYTGSKEAIDSLDELKETNWVEQTVYNNIAECYLQGNQVKQDIQKGKLYLSKSAKMGNYEAAHQLASIQLFSSENPEEMKLGFKHLESEYKNGSAYSAGKLGWAYQDGLGTEKNLKKAKELYEYAAKHGMTYWQYLLAHAYEKGYLGYQVDLEKSKYWLEFEPKIHIDHYECWVVNYYNNGIFPKNDTELNNYSEKCNNAEPIN